MMPKVSNKYNCIRLPKTMLHTEVLLECDGDASANGPAMKRISYNGHEPYIARLAEHSSRELSNQFCARYNTNHNMHGSSCIAAIATILNLPKISATNPNTLQGETKGRATKPKLVFDGINTQDLTNQPETPVEKHHVNVITAIVVTTQKNSFYQCSCDNDIGRDTDTDTDDENGIEEREGVKDSEFRQIDKECNGICDTPIDKRKRTQVSTAPTPSRGRPVAHNNLGLEIWRFANHVPLFAQSADALGCSITSAVRAAGWGKYGYMLQFNSENHNASDTQWALVPQRPELAQALQQQQQQEEDQGDNSNAKINYRLLIVVDIVTSNGKR
jgi:hypothetical protein